MKKGKSYSLQIILILFPFIIWGQNNLQIEVPLFDKLTERIQSYKGKQIQISKKSNLTVLKTQIDEGQLNVIESLGEFNNYNDFVFQLTLKINRHSDNASFSVLFSSTQNGSTNGEWILRSDGLQKINLRKGKKNKVLLDWQNSDFKKQDWVHLKIEKKYNCCSFYINNQKVFANCSFYDLSNGFGLSFNGDWNITFKEMNLTLSKRASPDVVQSIFTSKAEKLPPEINSDADEINPIVSPDENSLYFTRENHAGNIGDRMKQDTWICKIHPDFIYGEVFNPGPPINNSEHNFAEGISSDNQSIFLGNSYANESLMSGQGLSMMKMEVNGWSKPTKLILHDFINTSDQVDFYITPDRKLIFMSVEMPGGFGGLDLYVAQQIQENIYSTPINLGPEINTEGDEIDAYFRDDTKLLFFSSTGHPSFGNADIFVARKKSSWNQWDSVQNLGSSINTSQWESGFFITESGNRAFFCSNRTPETGSDIYSIFSSPSSLGVAPAKITIRNLFGNTQQQKECKIYILKDSLTLEGIQEMQMNPNTMEFAFFLSKTSNYRLLIDIPEAQPVLIPLNLKDSVNCHFVKINLFNQSNKMNKQTYYGHSWIDMKTMQLSESGRIILSHQIQKLKNRKIDKIRVQLNADIDKKEQLTKLINEFCVSQNIGTEYVEILDIFTGKKETNGIENPESSLLPIMSFNIQYR